MRNVNKKSIIIYILMLSYTFFFNIFRYKYHSNAIINLINPLFYIIIFIISLLLSNTDHKQRIKEKVNKYQTMFIIITSYLIIYILLGLFLGYVRTIYDHSIIGIIKNIWIYITPIIFIELIRNILVRNSNNNRIFFLLIVIIFSLIDLNLYSLMQNHYTTSDLFKLIFSTIIPTIITNCVLTYTSKTSGYITNLIYRLPQNLTNIILPIIPDLDWYFKALLGILLPLFAFIVIKNLDTKIEIREKRSRLRKSKITRMIPFIIPLIIFALFVAGFFKYKPTAIMSNSMHPIYDRGDVVIVEKTSKTLIDNLEKYDIIEYILDGTIVAHRIIHIEEHNDGTKLYITKGDNNNMTDKEKINNNQILGKVKFRIPKIGYPSVWLNEFLNKKQAVVETGK